MGVLEKKVAGILMEDSFKIDIRNAGIFRFSPCYRFGKHNHKEVEIVCIKSGHCIMEVEDIFVPLQEGDCIVLCPGVPHCFTVDLKVCCLISQLEFCIEVPDFVKREFVSSREERFYKLDDCDMLKGQIENICRCYRLAERNQYGTVQIKLMFLQLFIELTVRIRESRGAKKNGKIEQVISYINEHYGDDLTVEGLAESVGISSRYLRRCFRENTGISCSGYITSVRIEKAKKLLWSSSKTVTEIAGLTGFNSSQYFSRIFYQYVGRTPSQYRDLWKGHQAEERYFIELDKEESI